MVDNVIANMLFFDTVGLMGAYGVKSGELKIPQDDSPVAVMIVKEELIFETHKEYRIIDVVGMSGHGM